MPRWIWPAVAALAGGLIYAGTLRNGFALDDVPLIRDNPALEQAPARLPHLLLEPYWPPAQGGAASGLYRPVTIASYLANRALTGPAAIGFHAINVLLHAAVSLLVWYVVRGLSVHYGTPLLASLAFAMHPLHAEAVAGIAGRAELLGALFVFMAWLAHRRAITCLAERSQGLWAAVAGLSYLAALLSKENTILAPLVFWLDGRWEKARQGRLAAVYGVALAAGLALRYSALSSLLRAEAPAFIDNPAASEPVGVRLATALWAQAKIAGLCVWPVHLSSDYSYDAIPVVTSVADTRLLVGLLVLAGWLALFALAFRRSRPVAVGVACWLLFLLPTSSLLFPSGTILAERLAYLPLLGVAILFGHGLAALARDRPQRKLAVGLFAALALALWGWRTVVRSADWKDNETLALHDARVQPRSAKLHAGVAIALHARGDLDGAAAAYRRALEIYPDYAQMHYNLGQLLLVRGDRDGALEHLERATALAPDNPSPWKSLAPLLDSAGRIEPALRAYEAGVRLDPLDLPLRFNFGRALLAAGHTAEAIRVLDALAEDAPAALEGRLGLALGREAEGRLEEAAAIYRQLLAAPLPPGIRASVEQRLKVMDPRRGSPEAPRSNAGA